MLPFEGVELPPRLSLLTRVHRRLARRRPAPHHPCGARTRRQRRETPWLRPPALGYVDGMPAVAIVDIDGTLVDTNYQHTIAWQRALASHGYVVPAWRVHHAIGMGGDQLVGHLVGDEADRSRGAAIRDAEQAAYQDLIGEVRPLPGARPLLIALRERGLVVVLASSAKEEEVDHYLDLLDARELAHHWTTSADVERTKPEPDLIRAALDRAGVNDAVMVGDTVWDVRAAARVDVPTIALLSGGSGEAELRAAGAAAVYDDAAALLAALDRSILTGVRAE